MLYYSEKINSKLKDNGGIKCRHRHYPRKN
jgi:hypothetical protein